MKYHRIKYLNTFIGKDYIWQNPSSIRSKRKQRIGRPLSSLNRLHGNPRKEESFLSWSVEFGEGGSLVYYWLKECKKMYVSTVGAKE
jgi:hypothetical protein